ncbi:MAG: response regulator [Chloroflexota bacterium]|nr:response regulator transcription factor [Chloroflexota bacterium]MBI5704647.1 response regulator transcription factor [Chloroflexota bacterium]
MTTILLADDHQVLREALRFLLESQPDFHVVAETGDGLEAAALVEKHRPDVLIVDMRMPGLSGLEVARRTKRLSPATKVIILSMYDAEAYVMDSLAAGAAGYVLKQSSSQELLSAIRQTLAGGLYLSPSLNERALQSYIQHSREAHIPDPFDLLTDREREVLQLAAEGLNNPQIAEKLSISPRTVEMHRAHLMQKLGLKTQTDLVKYALKRGLV